MRAQQLIEQRARWWHAFRGGGQQFQTVADPHRATFPPLTAMMMPGDKHPALRSHHAGTVSARRPTTYANCGANSSSTSQAEPAAATSGHPPHAPSPPTLRDQVIAPILAAVRSPRMGRKPAHWTRVDRDYERIRIDMQTVFSELAIETPLAA